MSISSNEGPTIAHSCSPTSTKDNFFDQFLSHPLLSTYLSTKANIIRLAQPIICHAIATHGLVSGNELRLGDVGRRGHGLTRRIHGHGDSGALVGNADRGARGREVGAKDFQVVVGQQPVGADALAPGYGVAVVRCLDGVGRAFTHLGRRSGGCREVADGRWYDGASRNAATRRHALVQRHPDRDGTVVIRRSLAQPQPFGQARIAVVGQQLACDVADVVERADAGIRKHRCQGRDWSAETAPVVLEAGMLKVVLQRAGNIDSRGLNLKIDRDRLVPAHGLDRRSPCLKGR